MEYAENMNSRLSVCMATRSGGKYIAEQLSSILQQLDSDDEIVISDDSSTDDTINIIKSFNDPRIHLSENNTFYSPVYNFENALKMASGGVIAMSDQDDIWMDGKVATIRKVMSSSSDRYLMVILNGLLADEAGNPTDLTIAELTRAGNGLLKNLYDSSYIGCCMAFKRDLLEIALPFPKNLPMHDWWLGLLNDALGKVCFNMDLTIKYRRHEAAITDLFTKSRSYDQVACRVIMAFHLAARLLSLSLKGSGDNS